MKKNTNIKKIIIKDEIDIDDYEHFKKIVISIKNFKKIESMILAAILSKKYNITVVSDDRIVISFGTVISSHDHCLREIRINRNDVLKTILAIDEFIIDKIIILIQKIA